MEDSNQKNNRDLLKDIPVIVMFVILTKADNLVAIVFLHGKWDLKILKRE